MTSMTHYYGRMKGGLSHINKKSLTEFGEDAMVATVAGLGLGLLSSVHGGLDRKMFGVTIPLDGLASVGLGLFGIATPGKMGRMLKIASIATAGSAGTRTFERFFKGGFHIKGEFEDLGGGATSISGYRFHGHPGYPETHAIYGHGVPSYGFGAGAQDRLVEASRYL